MLPYGEIPSSEWELLDTYLGALAATPVHTLDRQEQYAFWLNLHNALVVRLIARAYLVLSVRDIDLGNGTPWDRPIVEVEGALSAFRIFATVFCAHIGATVASLWDFYGAVGSPGLLAQGFSGANVDRLLDEQALDFVNHPRGVWADGLSANVSSLYKWYAEDFGGSRRAVLSHLRLYALPGLRRMLPDNVALNYAFDWSLNDATGSLG